MLKEVSIFQRQAYRDGEKIIYKVTQDKFSASRNTKDILPKLPGVTIRSGSVRVNGMEGVLVQIDGRGELKDQSRQLSLLSAYSSDQIEIITSPSSKYDGNVNSIINIITKKTRGVSNISSKITQPLYVDDKNLGLDILSAEINSNLNFKIKDVRTSLVLNASKDKGIENAFSAVDAFSELKYDSKTQSKTSNYIIKGDLTFDYDLNKRSSLALNLNLYSSPERKYEAINSYNFFNPFTLVLDSFALVNNNLKNVVSEFEATGNYRYRLDNAKNSFLYFNTCCAFRYLRK